MGRVATPTTQRGIAARTDLQLRELDRKVTRAAATAGDTARGELDVSAAAAPVSTTATTQTTAATVTALGYPLLAGRRYKVTAPDLGVYSAAAGHIVVQVTYTLDGTTATASSPRLKQTAQETSGNSRGVNLVGYLEVAMDAVVSLLLSVYGAAAGTYTVVSSADWPALLVLEDVGPALSGGS